MTWLLIVLGVAALGYALYWFIFWDEDQHW